MMTPDAVRERLRDERRLAALERTGLLEPSVEECFERPVRLASRTLGTPVALLSVVDPHRQFFKSQLGLADPWASARETPLSHSLCQYVVASDASLAVTDTRDVASLRDNGAVEDLDVVAYLGVPVRAPDGSTLASLCVTSPEPRRWQDQELETLTGLSRLVSAELELREAAATIARLGGRLAAAEDHRSELLTVEAHELRTPLACIIGGVGLLSRVDLPLGDERRGDILGMVARNSARLMRLVDDLVTISGRGRGAGEDEVRVVDAFEAIRMACVQLEDQCTGPRIDGDLGALVWTDATDLIHILRNLLSNAAIYGSPPVHVGIRDDGRTVSITVEDAGDGIPASFIDSLFRPFRQVSTGPRRTAQGLGNGLAAARILARQNQGELSYDRAPSGGARFQLTLPSAPGMRVGETAVRRS